MNVEKIEKIVAKIANVLDLPLVREINESRFDSNLRYKGKWKGVVLFLLLQPLKGKIRAYFSVSGNNRAPHREKTHSREINFSDSKSESAIYRDLVQRLEMEKAGEFAADILKARDLRREAEDLEKAQIAAFRHFIPFEHHQRSGWNDYYSAFLGSARFELSGQKDELTIKSNNLAVLMRICAAAQQIINEESKKAA